MGEGWILAGKALLLAMIYLWAYWQAFRGTGWVLGAFVGAIIITAGILMSDLWLILVIIFLLFGVFALIRTRKQRRNFEAPSLVFEGGGIRRGLSPIEVGHYLGVTRAKLLGLSMLELLDKELLIIDGDGVVIAELFEDTVAILNPTERRKERKAQARKMGKELSDLEDMLIEVFSQHQSSGISLAAFQVWEDQLALQAHYRVGGFDVAQTLDYYRDYLTHRVNGVAAGHFPAGSFLPWLRLALLVDAAPETKETALIQIERFQPSWLPEGLSLNLWLDNFLANLGE